MGNEADTSAETFSAFAGKVRALEEPQNLFKGQCLPRKLALPDNILLFYHDFCETQPNAHGRYTLVMPFAEMRYLLDNKQIEMAPGELLLIRPHQLRFLQPDSKGFGRLFITFNLPSPQPYLPQFSLGKLTPDLQQNLSDIVDAYRDGRTFEVAVLIVWTLKRIAKVKLSAPPKTVSDLAANAVRYINEHISESFSIDNMAASLHSSGGNLRLRFRREIGTSLGRYIAQQRLGTALHYLKATSLDISEITRLCGFESLFSFSHFFKNATGKSPSLWRKGHLKRQDK